MLFEMGLLSGDREAWRPRVSEHRPPEQWSNLIEKPNLMKMKKLDFCSNVMPQVLSVAIWVCHIATVECHWKSHRIKDKANFLYVKYFYINIKVLQILWLLSALRCVNRRNMWLTQLKAQEADPYCQPMLGLIILLPPIFLVLASSFSSASCNFCLKFFSLPISVFIWTQIILI